MARPGKVWWNEGKQAWYSTIGGKKTRIADGGKTEAEARELWHQMHAKEIAVDLKHCNPLRVIFELFMEWRDKCGLTGMWQYRFILQSCLDFYKVRRHGIELRDEVRVRDVTAAAVHQWLDEHPEWSDGTKWMAATVVVAALNWAAKPERRLIDHNPIAGMARPAGRSRGEEALISPGQEASLVAGASDAMRDVIVALRQTGTRPGNVRRVEAKDIDFARGCIVLAHHKTRRKTGRAAVIPVTPTLAALLRRLCARHPQGPLFRTPRGSPWTVSYLIQSFAQLRRRVGLPETVTLYGFRHTTATDLLLAGVPDAKVAAVLGHKDTKMLYHHYGHLAGHIKALGEDLDAAINGKSGTAPAEPRPRPAAGAVDAPAGGETPAGEPPAS